MPRLISHPLKPKLEQKGHVIGTFLEIPSPQLVELLGLAGFDFVIVDREHGTADLERTEDLIRAGLSTGISVLVRAPDCDPVAVRLPLDMGAAGVHVPQIESAEMARSAIRAAMFHPRGERGMQPFVRSASFRAYPTAEYLAETNDNITVVLHIEGRGGIAALDEILTLPDLGVAFLGPYDLSQSLGIPGQVKHPAVREKMKEAIEKGRSKGAIVGTYADDVATAVEWRQLGVQYLAISIDAAIFLSAARDIVEQLRGQ